MTTLPDLRNRYSHPTHAANLEHQPTQSQSQTQSPSHASAAKAAALIGAVSAFPTKTSKPTKPSKPAAAKPSLPQPIAASEHPSGMNAPPTDSAHTHTRARAAAAAVASPPTKKKRPQPLASNTPFTAAALAQSKSQEHLGIRTPKTPTSEFSDGVVGVSVGAQAAARGAQASPKTTRHNISRPPSPSPSHTAAALASANTSRNHQQGLHSSRPASPSHTAATLASARHTPQRQNRMSAPKPKPIPAWFYDRDVPVDYDAAPGQNHERDEEAAEVLPAKGTVTNVKQWLRTLDHPHSEASGDGASTHVHGPEDRTTLPHSDGLSLSTTGQEASTTLPHVPRVPPKPRPNPLPVAVPAADALAPTPSQSQTKTKPPPPPILSPKPVRITSGPTALTKSLDPTSPKNDPASFKPALGPSAANPPAASTQTPPKPPPRETRPQLQIANAAQPQQQQQPAIQPPSAKPTPPAPRRQAQNQAHSSPRRPSYAQPRSRPTSLTADTLASAIVASTLAASTSPSPSTSPAPPSQQTQPQPRQPHHLPFRRHSNTSTRDSSPSKPAARYTMRSEHSPDTSKSHLFHRSGTHGNKSPPARPADPPGAKGRSSRPRIRKHPHKHAEASRKRYRDTVTPNERKRYEGVWAANRSLLLDNAQEGRVHALVVRDIFARSRLPDATLREIYELVDHAVCGSLAREEFVVGLWLCDQRLKGRKVPVRVGEGVWAGVRGWGGVRVPGVG